MACLLACQLNHEASKATKEEYYRKTKTVNMDGQDAQDKTEDCPVLYPVHPAYPC
jgi:hypothetical protein